MIGIREDDIQIPPDGFVRFAIPHTFVLELCYADFFIVVEAFDEFEDSVGLVCHYFSFPSYSMAIYFCLGLLGLSGIVKVKNPFSINGLSILFLK